MNLHQCLQLALNNCNLGAEVSHTEWATNTEVLLHLKLILSYKADDAAYNNWMQQLGHDFRENERAAQV